ncbi:MAG: ABC transporter permease [Lactobacillus sp.]|jgi:ABC-2 type transport system permease protein|nr:ABC transporter permease [Lactobacillus sp.]MCI2033460.1 ABC transporter permease [Lactobacillus sp.]
MLSTHYAKTGQLLRLNLRRDWLKLTLWLIGLVGLMAGAAAKFDGLYGTPKTMASIITTLKTPAMVSLLGPFTAEKPYTVAAIYAAEMMVFMGLFVAMMNIYFAIHATRSDEDSGVVELVRAHAVGRNATLTAAILQLILLNFGAGILEALGLQLSGMSGMDSAGNWLFGLGLAAFGLMFGVFSLLFAQIADSSRSATIFSYSWLGLLFIARMGTDIQNPDNTWYTIYGWIEKLEIYGANQWQPVVLMLGLTVIVGALTVGLSASRDVGAGLLPQRAGRRQASLWLRGPLSLVGRLERASTMIWLIGLFILGATYGSIFGTAGDLLNSNPTMAKLIGTAATHAANRTIVLAFANKLAVIFVILATIPGLIILFRLNTDERKGYFEQLHARSVSRLRLYSSLTGYGLVIALLAFGCGMLGMIVVGDAAMPDAPTFSRFMRAFWGYAPALIVTYGIGALFVGLLPRWQTIAWVLPAYGFFSLYLGSLMNFPKWLTQLTPYGWVNNVPVKAVQWPTAGWMTALGAILIIGGYLAYAKRDLIEN